MSARSEALLRQALVSIQAHAAGLHAAADMAMRLLDEGRNPRAALEAVRQAAQGGPGRPIAHYDDPTPDEAAKEVERLFDNHDGGAPQGAGPAPAPRGQNHASQE